MTDATLSATPVSQTISPAGEVWLSLKANKGAMAGLIVIVILVLAAVSADVIAPYHYAEVFKECVTKACPPVWQEGSDSRFFLGADAVGRDLLSRIIYGSRYSLFIGTIVVTISLAAGILFGLLSAARSTFSSCGRWTSSSPSRACCWRWRSSPFSGPACSMP
jgi:dipeptide transport system permease protein